MVAVPDATSPPYPLSCRNSPLAACTQLWLCWERQHVQVLFAGGIGGSAGLATAPTCDLSQGICSPHRRVVLSPAQGDGNLDLFRLEKMFKPLSGLDFQVSLKGQHKPNTPQTLFGNTRQKCWSFLEKHAREIENCKHIFPFICCLPNSNKLISFPAMLFLIILCQRHWICSYCCQ